MTEDDNTPETTRRSNRNAVKDGFASLQTRASEAEAAALDAVQANPVAAIAAAAAAGAVLAGVLPTSTKERQALGPVARKAREAAGVAVSKAKSSGIAHLTESGLTKTAITTGVTGLVGAILNASQAAASQQAENDQRAHEPRAQETQSIPADV